MCSFTAFGGEFENQTVSGVTTICQVKFQLSSLGQRAYSLWTDCQMEWTHWLPRVFWQWAWIFHRLERFWSTPPTVNTTPNATVSRGSCIKRSTNWRDLGTATDCSLSASTLTFSNGETPCLPHQVFFWFSCIEASPGKHLLITETNIKSKRTYLPAALSLKLVEHLLSCLSPGLLGNTCHLFCF